MNLAVSERRGVPDLNSRLVVTNLPYDVTEEELTRIFFDCGNCKVTVRK